MRQLVVIDIVPVEYDHSHTALIEALQDLDLHDVRNRADADHALREAVPDNGIRQFLLQNLLLEHIGFAGVSTCLSWRAPWTN